MMLRADGNLTDLDEITTTRGLDGESWTVRLTAPQLRSVNVQWFNGGASFPAGVYQIDCSGAYNNAVLSPWIDWRIGAKSAWDDYGNLGMTVRYYGPSGTCNSKVSDLVVSAPVLQFTHAGGQIGMWNHDSGIISDNNGDVTYTLRFYQDIDTDGDGIPDWLEVAGWCDGFGNQHFTDPNSADSDGDGLTDGEEAGQMIVVDGKIYFILVSDPNSADGDGDGISDLLELTEFGTDPLARDSDHDGLTDSYELDNGTNPNNPDSDGDGWIDGKDGEPSDAGTHEYSPQRAAAELVLGFTLGAYAEENHDNVYYLIGSSLSGIVLVGDIRDAGVYISQGDKQMALVCLVGLVPTGGDGAKFIGKLTRQFDEFPELALKKECREVAVEAIRKNCPTEVEKIAALDEIYAGSGTRLTGDGVQADDLMGIISESKKNGDLRLIQSGKRWNDRLVLYPDSQINHYINKHVLGTEYGNPGTKVTFFPLGHEVRPGIVTPNAMTREQLDQLIDDSIRYGIPKLDHGDWVYIYQPNAYGIEKMKTITKTTGEFKSSYPTKGPNVLIYEEPLV